MCDSLLPQIATDFHVTVGSAASIITAYAVTYGLLQAFYGPIGDRFGKYLVILLACFGSALTVAACAFAPSLSFLTLARLLSGATAAAVIPLSIAFIGDVVPFGERQVALARFMSGQIAGLITGQVAGGVIGQYLGWRAAFVFMGLVFLLVAAALATELASTRRSHTAAPVGEALPLAHQYRRLFQSPLVRTVLLGGLFEGMFLFGAFAYVGALLHIRFDLGFGPIGLILACFGIGGIVYALTLPRIARRLGERGAAWIGTALVVTAFATLAITPNVIVAAAAVACVGAGFYFFHNVLQLNATQMAPGLRGAAVSLFASCFYGGQAAGVAMAAPLVDRFGPGSIFALAALLMAALGTWLITALGRQAAPSG
jgi:predicted MFS family arabinose efflux permease